MTDYLDRLTPPTPGDELELFMREMDRGIRERHPGAFGPPVGIHDDKDAAPKWEQEFHAAVRALWSIEDAEDHEAIAKAWDRVSEAAMDAAHAEWKLARGEVRE